MSSRFRHTAVLVIAVAAVACRPPAGLASSPASRSKQTDQPGPTPQLGFATFAGGCFWCMEAPFEGLDGVVSVVSGFTGGSEPDPTYRQVASGATGHTEAIQITYDPMIISYDSLLEVYWRSFDPTDAGGQFADRGSQYRPAIFYHDEEQRQAAERSRQALADSGRFAAPIVVGIEPFTSFTAAEEYHQNYYRKNPERYKAYHRGSGRERFLAEMWGDDQVSRPPAVRFTRPTQEEIRRRLSSLQYHVTQRNGTEPPFANRYWNHEVPGIYVDIVSGEPLFSSRDKFDSGTGWPSFSRPLVAANVLEQGTDGGSGRGVEVRSRFADSHLGHLFTDGPPPTGLRYCINSAALRFIPAEDLQREGYSDLAADLVP